MLEHLNIDLEYLKMLHDIMDDDFKVSGDLTNERRYGQQSDTLPWFWRISEPVGTYGSWLQECKFPNHSLFLQTNLVLVYRVSWLRAKAHFFWWSEELPLVGYEMQWMVNWFRWKEGEWKKRLGYVTNEDRPPHEASNIIQMI